MPAECVTDGSAQTKVYATSLPELPQLFLCLGLSHILYNAGMPKRQIGVEVLIEDHFWNDEHGRYVYSFHCPACVQLRLTPELGIYRCECGSWLIVTNQR